MISSDVIQKALAQLKRPANVAYFFDQLKSPDWIEPLYNEGFFCKPPSPVQEGNLISFHIWPESRYLVRMASLAPEKVRDILLKLPETENVWVHSDILDAAAKMPSASVEALVDKEIKWLASKKHIHFLSVRSLTALLDHLVEGKQSAVALRLTRAALAFRTEKDTEEESRRRFSSADPIIEDWHYKEILGKQIPKLISLAGVDAFELLCDLLKQAIGIYVGKEKNTQDDYSEIWRPSVVDHEQNRHHSDIKSEIVTSIRDAGLFLLDAKKLSIEQLAKTLEAKPSIIFQRLALYFLAIDPSQHIKIIEERLTDHTLFEKVSTWHEYYNLMEAGYGYLNAAKQKIILDWIDTGPDTDLYKRRTKENWGKDLSDAELERLVVNWKLRRLMPIHSYLDSDWSKRYQEWAAQVKLPPHPDFHHYSTGVMSGPTSPTDANTMAAMSVEELVAHLKALKFTDQFMGPSPEGVGRVLAPLVAENPERFATSCAAFKNSDPTYIRAILNGLRDAVKKPLPFSWQPVLEFCKWIVDQPRAIEGRVVADDFHQDPDWGYTRSVIAQLLSAGLQEGKNSIPFTLRTLCWEILYPLTSDPDPSREREIEYGDNFSPMTLSINTTRGDALHTVFRYILWVDRHLYGANNAKDKPKLQFKEIPEVEVVLNHHLIPENDATACTRAVYGQWMHTLVWFGKDWVAANLTKLFPTDPKYKYLRDACWETFLVCSQPYSDFFTLFEREYKEQINELGKADKKKKRSENWEEFYAGHLAVYQCLGLLPKEMLNNFYSKASIPLRKHIMEYLRRSLATPEDSISDSVMERIKSLWESRLTICEKNTDLADEVIPFGWWLVSERFDATWALDQAHRVLKITHGKIAPDFMVVKYLSSIASSVPGTAIDCLKLMIGGDKEGWFIQSHQEEIRTILRSCLSSGNSIIVSHTTQLIHKIGARGIAIFRDLLSAPSSQTG